VYKIVGIMGVYTIEKTEFAAYQLKGVAQVLFEEWKWESDIDAGPVDWEKFKGAFIDHFFPLEMRDAKVLEFSNLCQGNMSVNEYALKFTNLILGPVDMASSISAKVFGSRFF